MNSVEPNARTVGSRLVGAAIALGVLAGGFGVLIWMLGQRETLYEGKSCYYWSEQLKSQNPAVTNQVSLVLNREIIPRLTKTILEDTSDSKLRIALVEKLNDLPGVNIFFRTADCRRGDAAIALGQFGPQAEAAVPTLLQVLQGHDSAVRGAAVVSLGHIRAKPEIVIPLLIPCLDDNDLREVALAALGEYGSRAMVVIPKLLLLLKVQDKDLHKLVQEVLKKIDPDVAAQAPAESL
jgi:hypothetical protein